MNCSMPGFSFLHYILEFAQTHVHWISDTIQSSPTLCNLMGCSTPGFPVLHYILEFAQTNIHGVGDTIQPSHPLSRSSPPALNLLQHQGLFQRLGSLHQVAKVLVPKLKFNTLATWCTEPTHWKRPWCWESLRAEGEGVGRGWDSWKASLTQWTWVWANSKSLWRTEKPGVLQFIGSQRVGYDLTIKQQQHDLFN